MSIPQPQSKNDKNGNQHTCKQLASLLPFLHPTKSKYTNTVSQFVGCSLLIWEVGVPPVVESGHDLKIDSECSFASTLYLESRVTTEYKVKTHLDITVEFVKRKYSTPNHAIKSILCTLTEH